MVTSFDGRFWAMKSDDNLTLPRLASYKLLYTVGKLCRESLEVLQVLLCSS
jgi:hypothetical protein